MEKGGGGRGEAARLLLGAALLDASTASVLKRVLLLLSQLGAQVIPCSQEQTPEQG